MAAIVGLRSPGLTWWRSDDQSWLLRRMGTGGRRKPDDRRPGRGSIPLPERVAAPITAFGGGVLLAAVAFELVPDADEHAGLGVTAIGMLLGTAVFVGADAWLSRDESTDTRRRSRHAAAAGRAMMRLDRAEAARGESIAVGIFVDGVPE